MKNSDLITENDKSANGLWKAAHGGLLLLPSKDDI